MNRTQPQHRGASTLSQVPFTTGKSGLQNMEGGGLSRAQVVTSTASAAKTPPHSARFSFACSRGQGSVWIPDVHSVQNRIPVTAEDPEALPQHKKLRWLYNTSCVHGLGHCALKPLLSGEGGEKQHLGEQSRQEGEKLLHFQAHVLGDCTCRDSGQVSAAEFSLEHAASLEQVHKPWSPRSQTASPY